MLTKPEPLPAPLDAALRQLGVIPRPGQVPEPQPARDWSFKAVDGEPNW